MVGNKNIQALEHILKYTDDIVSAVQRFGNDFNTFRSDRDYYNFVSMSLLQIGELSTHLSDEFRRENSGIQWGLIKGMRNHFAHGYSEMYAEEIWDAATRDVPGLRKFCRQILEERKEKETGKSLQEPVPEIEITKTF
jgi:uncharacterized protein with HEPN domain